SKNLVSGAIKFLFGKYMSYSPFIISSEVNLKIHPVGVFRSAAVAQIHRGADGFTPAFPRAH
ncbi:MAG: hypothetical protein E7B03_02345, partial [Negativicoccus succinicivorans]|nr:hypothetical protein [Negativicoccus succinicivorans]